MSNRRTKSSEDDLKHTEKTSMSDNRDFNKVMVKISYELSNSNSLWSEKEIKLYHDSFIVSSKKLSDNQEKLCKMITLLDKTNSIGCIAITYNSNIESQIKTDTLTNVVKVMMDPWFESESTMINPVYKSSVSEILEEQYSITRKIIDKEMDVIRQTGMFSHEPLFSQSFKQSCRKDMCFVQNQKPDEVIQQDTDLIWIPNPGDEPMVISKQCFVLKDLLIGIYKEENNPYTNKPFDKSIVKTILKTHSMQFEIVRIYFKMLEYKQPMRRIHEGMPGRRVHEESPTDKAVNDSICVDEPEYVEPDPTDDFTYLEPNPLDEHLYEEPTVTDKTEYLEPTQIDEPVYEEPNTTDEPVYADFGISSPTIYVDPLDNSDEEFDNFDDDVYEAFEPN
jgi:hypothetical protein